jgi:hypothetical protein
MKKTLLYITIVVLYLLTPVCVMGTLGTMVSSKYEVDESYWLIDGNDNLTADQKQKKINELDNKGRQLKIQAYTFAFFAFATFVTATGLIIKRKHILGGQKSST